MNHLVLIDDRIGIRSESAFERDIRIQFPILVEIDDAQLIGAPDFAMGGQNIAAHQSEQCCLAAAIRADKADPHCRFDCQMNTSE